MRLVIQRVFQASVTSSVPGQPTVTSSINKGMMVLVGFEKGDTDVDMEAMRKQLFKLRIFSSADNDDPPKKNSLNIVDAQLDILLVSQFTLNAALKSGRPSFHRAMDANEADKMFSQFVTDCRAELPDVCQVHSGVFGSYMQVHLVNDGPYTICMTCREGKCDTW